MYHALSTKGAASPPSNLSISTAPVSLTWLAPPNGPTDCVFNYTINITNYSSSSSCYSTSNTESLILTDDLITRGHDYSLLWLLLTVQDNMDHGVINSQSHMMV